MKCLIAMFATAACAALGVAQDSRPTSRPSDPNAPKARNGGFFGLQWAETRRGDDAVLRLESVLEGSDAERLGFRAGDVITGVCDVQMDDGDHFIKLLYGTMGGDIGQQARRMTGLEVPDDGPFVNVVRGDDALRIRGGIDDLDASPAVGDPAPDFRLRDADGENEVVLSELIGDRPVVLVFGSYT